MNASANVEITSSVDMDRGVLLSAGQLGDNSKFEYNYFVYKNMGVQPRDFIKDRFHGVPNENKAFVDRQATLEMINAALSDENFWSSRSIVVLTGREQVGKTQLMLNYSYLHRDAYKFAVWLKVDDTSVADSFLKLAITLGYNAKDSDSKDAAKWVRTSFEREINWLLLLDNADDVMAKEIFSLLPRNGGHIILTTRKPKISINEEEVAKISIGKMEEEEALALLLGPSLAETIDRKGIRFRYIREIITKLDYMPLPIKLAHAYMDSTGISYQNYVSIFKKKRSHFFPCCDEDPCCHKDPYHDVDNCTHCKHTLATVWYLSFEQVRVAKPATVRILEICALLQRGSPSDLEFEEKIRPVRAVLPIFSFVAQSSKEPETDEEGSETGLLRTSLPVLEIINHLMDDGKKRKWAQRLAEIFDNEAILESNASLENILENSGRDFRTEKLAELIISIPEIVYGLNHPSTAIALGDLAELYSSQGNYVEAEILYRQSLTINKAKSNPNHLMILKSLSDLAAVCVKRRKFDEAELLYQKCLEIPVQALGSDHLFRATILSNLAELYGDQQKYDDAEKLYRQALEIREKAFGLEHQSVAKILTNLATLYGNQKKYDEAESFFQRALAIREKALGEEHPDVAISLNNLACFYQSQKKYDLAGPHYQRALKICEKKFGPEDPITGECQSNLGDFYQSQAKYKEAEGHHETALKIWNRAFGNENLYSVMTLGKLAELYKAQDIEYMVTPKLREIRAISKVLMDTEDPATVVGPDHPGTITVLGKWAELYTEQEMYDQAEHLYKRILVIHEKTSGPEDPTTVQSMITLISLYIKSAKYDEAELLCKQALAIREKTLGSIHSDTMQLINLLVILYLRWDKCDEAEPLLKRALAMRMKTSESEHSDIAQLLNWLGRLFVLQKDFAKVQVWYLKAAGTMSVESGEGAADITLNRFWNEVAVGDPQSTVQQFLSSNESESSVLFTIGVFCELGLGIPKDLPTAMEFFAKAAKLNELTASHYTNLLNYQNEEKPDVSDKPCGRVYDKNEEYYSCFTCGVETSCICLRCFYSTDHDGHDVVMQYSSGSGAFCDCGDPDMWRVSLHCRYHTPSISASENEHLAVATSVEVEME